MSDAPHAQDLPTEEFKALARHVVDWIGDYMDQGGALPVLARVEEGEIRAALPTSPPEVGEQLQDALDDFRRVIVPGITHWNHPAFFGYFATSASAAGVLGEMLTAALNVNAMVWRSSPAATELEFVATDWLRQLVGLPEGFEGVINDTASSSTLYALAAARDVAFPGAQRAGLFGQPRGRVYTSDQAHSSVEKALLTLGMGVDGCAKIPTDRDFGMRPDALGEAIREDLGRGVRPVAVVATLGTTSSTAIDPVAEVADVAAEHGLWVHVDAAYGGPAAILPEVRERYAGWEGAHSIVLNPHKWLFTPMDCSVLYCRRPEALLRAFSVVPEYLTSPDRVESRDLMNYGVSLGRRFRALKLWFVMRCFGREGLADRIRAHIELAQELASWVDEAPGWERVAPTPLSTVTFRYVGSSGADPETLDAANLAIVEAVNRTGDAFIVHTALNGRIALRVAIGNLRTTRAHVARVWEVLREAAPSD